MTEKANLGSLILNESFFDLSTPIVMGIVNATPDSFYKGNRFSADKELLSCVDKHLIDGATILDIGGYSTRPDAAYVTEEEEQARVAHAIEIILNKFPKVILSVDTFRSGIARFCVDNYNVAMINDIGGGTLDDRMFATIAELKVAYVLMHTKGNPANMQTMTEYTSFVSEVYNFLDQRIETLRSLGITQIVADPGFGFAKTMEQNYELLKNLSLFQNLNVPVLAGLSRKSMIYKLLQTDPASSLNATTAANMLALIGGASILRVHDVKEALEVIQIFKSYKNQPNSN